VGVNREGTWVTIVNIPLTILSIHLIHKTRVFISLDHERAYDSKMHRIVGVACARSILGRARVCQTLVKPAQDGHEALYSFHDLLSQVVKI